MVIEKWSARIKQFQRIGQIVPIEPQPKNKDFNHCKRIIKILIRNKINRRGCLIAVGGGYVGDMVGFIAATYMRGIDFMQIPTTLMAMGDPVIGKVAIDFSGFKNLLGAFYSPVYTFCDFNYLETLKSEEIVLGLAEVWKSALVINNKSMIDQINKLLESDCYDLKKLSLLAERSIKTKKRFVEADWNDKKGRHKALSLGHTFSNYFESRFKIRHGEGVCCGIVLAAILSRELEEIGVRKLNEIIKTYKLFNLRLSALKKIQRKINTVDLITKLNFDKINTVKGQYQFVVLTIDGFCVKVSVPRRIIEKVIFKFKKLMLVPYN